MKRTKKIFSVCLTALLAAGALFVFPASVSAEQSGDYVYEVKADGTAEITQYRGTKSEVDVPAQIDGKRVTGIGDWAFSGFYSHPETIRKVTVPGGVTQIGISAFSGCENLQEIILPDSVSKIGEDAFSYCTAMKSFKFPAALKEISNQMLAVCLSLESLEIPDGVTRIGEYAFVNCEGLKSTVIPDSVTQIGDNAFTSCPMLTQLTIGRGLEEISDAVFGTEQSTIENLVVIRGYPGTGAERFAKKHNIFFESLQEKSTLIYSADEIKEPLIAVGRYSAETIEDQYFRPYYNYAQPDRVYYYTDGASAFNAAVYDRKTSALNIYRYNGDSFIYSGVKHVPLPYEKLGGFYKGTDGNFYVVTGQDNLEENDNKTVVCVQKYNSAWKLTGTLELKGSESNAFKGIWKPFVGGICSMDMNGSELVLHMSREMYSQPDDILHHQSNITFYIDTKTMTKISGRKMPYVSHSLSQYVKYNGDRLVFLDHGDAYPRSVVMNTLENGTLKATELFALDGATGDNFTGTTVDALEVCSDGYLIAGASMPHQNALNGVTGAEEGKYRHNIYVIYVPQNGGSPAFRWITKNNPNDKSREVGEPRLVKLTNSRFALLYDEQALKNGEVQNHTLHCLLLDSKGNVLSQSSYDGIRFTGNSEPAVFGSRLVWTAGTKEGVSKIYAVPIPQENGSYRLGDANGDGDINLKDAILIQQHLAKMLTLTQEQSKAADTDRNGTVATADVLIIQKFIAKMIPEI